MDAHQQPDRQLHQHRARCPGVPGARSATRRLIGRVQIIDVFTLKVAMGCSRDPQGRPLLELPATPEALLRLLPDLEPQAQGVPSGSMRPEPTPAGMPPGAAVGSNPWRLVAWTALAWLTC